MRLDTATLLFAVALSGMIYGLFYVLSWRRRRTETELLLWGLASLCCGGCSVLMSFFGGTEKSLSTVMSNGLVVLFYALIWAGMRRFAGQPVRWIAVWMAPLVMVIVTAFGLLGFNSLSARINTYSLLSGCFCVICIVDAWKAEADEPLQMRRLTMALFAATLLITACRSWDVIHNSEGLNGFRWLDPWVALGFFMNFTMWSQSALLMVNERQSNRLNRAAHNDGLTGVLNRSGFQMLASRLVSRCAQDGHAVWLLLMDLDHFKKVNDEHGHDAGDQLLCAFAGAARAVLRSNDLIARYGGEEFCILLSCTAAGDAALVAERLRAQFQSVRVQAGTQMIGTTVSIGIAEVKASGESIEKAVTRADQALYTAKRMGRNQIQVFEQELSYEQAH